ncbi:MAG: hypothetical protein Ct9H300mP28_20210 [Pseudomonadota bacterium]|nr:MAG: hypothetical protein Ct9H300mP28_20210 [Pseudomonadota bacterium]
MDFSQTSRTVKAVDGISFEIKGRETLGLVGESGCGKSTTGRVILQLLEALQGNFFLKGHELTISKQIFENKGLKCK